MNTPKPSGINDAKVQPLPVAEPFSISDADQPHLVISKPAGSVEHNTAKLETIELDIGSDSDFNPDDPAHEMMACRGPAHLRMYKRFIVDLFVDYREARQAARRYEDGAYRIRWEERAERYAERAITLIETVHKMENHGQQKVVVEHRNDPDRQARTARRARSSVRQTQEVLPGTPNKTA
jgi:hypothetical protein